MPSDYKKIEVSLIATVFNEADSILDFLESYKAQEILAQELIIVDAFSSDQTYELIKKFSAQNQNLNIKLFRKVSNRSQARNFAATKASASYLAFTDAGCLLDRFWLAKLVQEQIKTKKRVVGGHFRGLAKSRLQEAIVPYFLQLNKKVNEQNFVPTTRSLLIEKKLWLELGGLNESLVLSEDYELMLRIKKQKIAWAFANQAIVYWLPPANFLAFLKKIANFASSDIEAGIIRPKVILIFLRYLFFLFLILSLKSIFFLVFFIFYLLWSIYKNQHNAPKAWFYLPLLQVSSDLMIMGASLWAGSKFKSRAF